MHKVIAPLRVSKSKSKMFSLNLNGYRNEHQHGLNNAKAEFKRVMTEQIQALPVFKVISLTYVFYPKTKHLSDLGNICSVVDKFFADALVELGKLPDDNYLHVPEINFRMGAIDSSNPRVEIIIKEIEV